MENPKSSIPDLAGSKDWTDKTNQIGESEVQDLVEAIHEIQARVTDDTLKPNHKAGPSIQRGFHAKGFGMYAKFKIRNDVSPNLRVGLFAEGGKEFDAIVRFSNAFSVNQKDTELDQRGLAIRVLLDSYPASENVQDFLMTNTPVSFGRNAQEFVKTSKRLVDHAKPIAFFLVLFQPERLRILKQLLSGLKTPSMAVERYWSRTPFQIGDYAMKYLAQPSEMEGLGDAIPRWKSHKEPAARWGEQDYLRKELEDLQRQLHQEGRAFKLDFRIQLYQDEERTPMENASKEWKENDAPFATVAELEIPYSNLNDEERKKLDEGIENMAFSPWTTKNFKPLGKMNVARRLVYDKSAEKRGGCPLSIGR
jgi:hypothetical protein